MVEETPEEKAAKELAEKNAAEQAAKTKADLSAATKAKPEAKTTKADPALFDITKNTVPVGEKTVS